MKKIGIFAVLVTITMSMYAYTDGGTASAFQEDLRGVDHESISVPQHTYSYVSYVLNVECSGTGTNSMASVTLDWGLIIPLNGNGNCNITKTGSYHNQGAPITLYALAVVNHDNAPCFASASAHVYW